MPEKLKGIIAAAHTPMHPDGSVNYEAIEKQVRLYQSNPIDGAFVCGTTGEGKLLTVEERKRVADVWLQCSQSDYPVVVHVGDDCMESCRELAKFAGERGAYAVASSAPSYFRPADVDDLVENCRAVAEAAPKLPFYFYHIPNLTYVRLPMIDFLKAGSKRIPNLAGIKFSHDDFADLFSCLRFDGGRYNMLFGRDEILIAALAFGVDGAVGSTYNYAAPLYRAIIEAFQKGDLDKARELQAVSIEIVRTIKQYNEIAVGKAIVTWLGVDCGGVRSPLKPLADAERRAIESAFGEERIRRYLCKYEG